MRFLELVRGSGPMRPLFAGFGGRLPLITGLGLLASVLEGVGIGVFVPLVALVLSGETPDGLPGPLAAAAGLILTLEPGYRFAWIVALAIGVALAKAAVQSANNLVQARLELDVALRTRNALAAQLLALEYPFFLAQNGSRLTQTVAVASWSFAEGVRGALAILPAFAALLVFSLLLVWLNWALFALVVIGSLGIAAALVLVDRRQRAVSVAVSRDYHALAREASSLVGAARAIRVFEQQASVRNHFERLSRGVHSSELAERRMLAALSPGVELLIVLLLIAIAAGAVALAVPLAELVVFLLLLVRAQPHAYALTQARARIASTLGFRKDVEWLLGQTDAAALARGSVALSRLDQPIRFEQVNYCYPDGTPAACDWDVSIEPGRSTAIIGRSGAGKSTLVNLLLRLVEPASGRIRVGDMPIEAIRLSDWRKRVAVAGQDVELIAGTIAQNIAFGRRDASRAEIEEVAQAAGVAEFAQALPQGYDTDLGERGIGLSGGQRQRIGLARALLVRPDLLILDEAMSAVDAPSEQAIVTLLHEHRFFSTAILISHRKSAIAACSDGIVMADGRITETGPLASLSYYRSMAAAD